MEESQELPDTSQLKPLVQEGLVGDGLPGSHLRTSSSAGGKLAGKIWELLGCILRT